MTPPDDISGTGCISDKRKFCAHIKAHILDISERDRSDCGGCAIQEKTNASDYMSTLKFQDSKFDFFPLFKEYREQTALPTEALSLNYNGQCLKACHCISRSEVNKEQALEDRHVHTHAHSVYTVLFGLFSY